MAIGDTQSTTLKTGWTLTASFTETGTNTTNNTSSISCSAKLTAGSAYSFSYSAGGGNLKIYWHDNNTNSDSLVASSKITACSSSNPATVSGTRTAAHKADGTLNGYAKAVWEKTHTSSYVPPSGNVSTNSKNLTKIPRKSSPTLSAASLSLPATSGTLTVTTNRASSSFTHTITLKVGSTTITTSTNVGASVSYNLTSIQNAILATIPNATSTTLTVICETFSGGTSLGTNSTTCAITVNSNAKPNFSNFTYADTNSTTVALTGNNQTLISGKSTLTAYISAAQAATAKYSATMKTYSFTINSQSATQAYTTSAITKTIGAVTLPSTTTDNTAKDLVVAAIDSRGLSTSVSKTITVIPYKAPVINASATRLNGFEAETTIAVSGKVSPILVGGTGKNSVNATNGLQYRYKAQNTTTWGAWSNIASTYNSTTGVVSTSSFKINLDNQNAFDMEFRLTDALGTSTASITISQGQPAMYIGVDDRRVSIGGMPTIAKNTANLGQLEVRGETITQGGRTTKPITTTSNGSWIKGRENSAVANIETSTIGTFAPTFASKTNAGAWSVGSLKSDNNLYFSYGTDANYNANKNTTSNFWISPSGTTNIVHTTYTHTKAEQRIGTWHDGKPICRKILTGTTPASGGTIVSHGISNFYAILEVRGFVKQGDNLYQPIPRLDVGTTARYSIGVGDFTSSGFWFNPGTESSFHSKPYEIELVYLKKW